jgi:hypothetical protein
VFETCRFCKQPVRCMASAEPNTWYALAKCDCVQGEGWGPTQEEAESVARQYWLVNFRNLHFGDKWRK